MSKIVWHKGPPPHVGWWLANTQQSNDLWRWWDGKTWSKPVSARSDIGREAATLAKQIGLVQTVEWSDYYPPNARVPRINPTGGTTP